MLFTPPFFAQTDEREFGRQLLDWAKNGFRELGDKGGLGIGATTHQILQHPDFKTQPSKVG